MTVRQAQLRILSEFNEISKVIAQQKILRNELKVGDDCIECRLTEKMVTTYLEELKKELASYRDQATGLGVSESELDRIVAYWKARLIE